MSYNIKFIGTLEIIKWIKDYFNSNVQEEQRHPDRNVNNYSITLGGNKQVYRILKELYDNCNIFLDRKYEKSMKILKILESS